MPRKPREKSATGIYHVITRGVGQQNLFHEKIDYLRYMKISEEFSQECGITVLGFCLMSNHIHLLLHDKNDNLSVFMKRIGISYASWYNYKYERTGHVFQDRFISEIVENRRYILAVLCYIHLNPVKAAIAIDPEKYEWSSCSSYYDTNKNKISFLDITPIMKLLDKNRSTAIEKLRKITSSCNDAQSQYTNKTRRRIIDSEAYQIITDRMNGQQLAILHVMDKTKRDNILSDLRKNGLSIRQISRITGLPLHIVRKDEQRDGSRVSI